jgi:hypothetical protein
MDALSGLYSPLTLGITALVALFSLAVKELAMTHKNVSRSHAVKILNIPIIISVVLFVYVFSRIVMGIMNV